jgi:hypothetical protein
MLTIQKCLQKHYQLLEEIPVDKDHFIEFNQRLIQMKGLEPTAAIRAITTIPELLDSLTVMTYFANLAYKPICSIGNGLLYQEDTPLYSLSTLPEGTLDIIEEETPPLYDLVVAHAVLYGCELPSKQELMAIY